MFVGKVRSLPSEWISIMGLTMTANLPHLATRSITIVKSFIVQALGMERASFTTASYSMESNKVWSRKSPVSNHEWKCCLIKRISHVFSHIFLAPRLSSNLPLCRLLCQTIKNAFNKTSPVLSSAQLLLLPQKTVLWRLAKWQVNKMS